MTARVAAIQVVTREYTSIMRDRRECQDFCEWQPTDVPEAVLDYFAGPRRMMTAAEIEDAMRRLRRRCWRRRSAPSSRIIWAIRQACVRIPPPILGVSQHRIHVTPRWRTGRISAALARPSDPERVCAATSDLTDR